MPHRLPTGSPKKGRHGSMAELSKPSLSMGHAKWPPPNRPGIRDRVELQRLGPSRLLATQKLRPRWSKSPPLPPLRALWPAGFQRQRSLSQRSRGEIQLCQPASVNSHHQALGEKRLVLKPSRNTTDWLFPTASTYSFVSLRRCFLLK